MTGLRSHSRPATELELALDPRVPAQTTPHLPGWGAPAVPPPTSLTRPGPWPFPGRPLALSAPSHPFFPHSLCPHPSVPSTKHSTASRPNPSPRGEVLSPSHPQAQGQACSRARLSRLGGRRAGGSQRAQADATVGVVEGSAARGREGPLGKGCCRRVPRDGRSEPCTGVGKGVRAEGPAMPGP